MPNFTFNVDIPSTGGPFDEIEIYYTEGWDPNSVTGTIVPGTGSNGVPVGKGLMTVTAVTYNSINVGDYFDLGGVTVESQLTQTTISTKTFSSGGAIGAFTFLLNNVTGVVIGQRPTGTGIPSGAMVIGVSGTTVTLDKAFTVQAAGSYLFTTAGGTGTYQVSISTTASGTDDLFDAPVDTDFIFLKNKVPDGNATAFASNSTVSILITELPANSQTFRRYFLKSRLGNKKNFGAFSPNVAVDIDGNSIPWTPNPTTAGRLSDLSDVNITSIAEGNTLYYDATTSKWRNTDILEISDAPAGDEFAKVNGILIVENPAGSGTNRFNRNSASTNLAVSTLNIRATSTGTPAVGFGPSILAESEMANTGIETVGGIAWVATDMTDNAEDFQCQISAMKNGALPDYKVYIDSDGNLSADGNLTLNYDQTAGNAVINAYSGATLGTLTWNGVQWEVNGDTLINDFQFQLNVNETYGYSLISGGSSANSGETGFIIFDGYRWKLDHAVAFTGQEDVANGAAIRLDKQQSYFITGATNETSTLAIGTDGQLKTLSKHRSSGAGNMVVTVTNPAWVNAATGTITFTNIGDSCLLQFIDEYWTAIGVNGVTFA